MLHPISTNRIDYCGGIDSDGELTLAPVGHAQLFLGNQNFLAVRPVRGADPGFDDRDLATLEFWAANGRFGTDLQVYAFLPRRKRHEPCDR